MRTVKLFDWKKLQNQLKFVLSKKLTKYGFETFIHMTFIVLQSILWNYLFCWNIEKFKFCSSFHVMTKNAWNLFKKYQLCQKNSWKILKRCYICCIQSNLTISFGQTSWKLKFIIIGKNVFTLFENSRIHFIFSKLKICMKMALSNKSEYTESFKMNSICIWM